MKYKIISQTVTVNLIGFKSEEITDDIRNGIIEIDSIKTAAGLSNDVCFYFKNTKEFICPLNANQSEILKEC